MKNIKFVSIALFAICLMLTTQQVLAQNPGTQQTVTPVLNSSEYVRPHSVLEALVTGKDDFGKLSFEVELNKTEFLLLEPITVSFKVSNPTTERIQAFAPKFLSDVTIKARCNDKSFEIRSLSGISSGSRDQTLIMPETIIEETDILQPSGTGYFPQPGTYQIQFILSNYGRSGGKLASSIFEVTIKEPTGEDREAYEFLKKNQQEAASTVFSFKDQFNKNIAGKSLLETFVTRYGGSIYGDYAAIYLGSGYKFRGETDKAKALFEKVSSSDNPALVKEATRSLVEIQEKVNLNTPNKVKQKN